MAILVCYPFSVCVDTHISRISKEFSEILTIVGMTEWPVSNEEQN